MMREIGSYEAKTHLAELLDCVQQGEWITITRRGKPVARLVPVADHERRSVSSAISAIKQLRAGQQLGKDLTVRQLIEEGRRL